jgi:hypothetical protein
VSPVNSGARVPRIVATVFVARAANPQALIPQLQQWASANGYHFEGNDQAGTFDGTSTDNEGAFLGRISGTYSVSGDQVTFRMNRDLSAGEIARRLAGFGLQVISSS